MMLMDTRLIVKEWLYKRLCSSGSTTCFALIGSDRIEGVYRPRTYDAYRED